LLYLFEDYRLDTDRRELYRATSPISIEPKVFDLLAYVIRNCERVVSKEDLVAAIWNGRIVSESALTTCINAARSAIGDSGEVQRLIKTLPRKGIRFVGVVVEEGKSAAAPVDAAQPSHPSIAIADKPSIAVLPFTNMSGDPERDYFSDGITEDIITELSRFRELLVIARNSSFQYRDKANDLGRIGRELNVQYVVEGSIRTAGGRVRVTAGVVDIATRTQLWTEHYDRDMQDIFAVQDEVAQAIAATVEGRVAASGARRSRRKPTHDLAAYDYFLQARECLERYDTDAGGAALPLLRRAVESDPGFARAYAWLSFATLMIYNTNLCPETLREGLMLARTAMSLDDSDAWSHRAIGFAYTLSRQFDLAGLHLGRAVELNPMDVRITSMRALWLAYMGRADDALRTVDADLRRDPFPPNWLWAFRGMALFQCRRYEEAIQALSRVDIRLWHCLYLASAHAHLGHMDQARAFVSQLRGFRADFKLGQVSLIETFKDPADLAPLVEGLRMAGLSE